MAGPEQQPQRRFELLHPVLPGLPLGLFGHERVDAQLAGQRWPPQALIQQLPGLDQPAQALMMVGEELPLRPLAARERKRRRPGLASGSGKLSRGRRPAGQ